MDIKKIKKKYGLTQVQLSKITGTSQKTISNYENNKTEPDINFILKLSDYLKTTTDAILGHEVPYLLDKSTLTPEQRDLVEQIKILSPENCNRVKDFITGILIAEEEKQKILNIYKRGQ